MVPSHLTKAKMLYLGIPEIENTLLETELKGSSIKNSLIQASEIIRIFETSGNFPSIFLFQVGTGDKRRIFGGYANEQWRVEENYFGNNTCFLFLFTQNDQVKLRENPLNHRDGAKYLWCNSHSLSFGEKDLYLNEDVKIYNDIGLLD